jgi:hyperosmotically inducible protein
MLFLGRVKVQEAVSMIRKSSLVISAFALMVATTAFAQTDAALSASVKTKLAADDQVKAGSVDVTTVDHVVTLSGSVPSQEVKERALKIAKDTTGVSSVVDRLTVRGVATGKTTAEKAAGGVEKGADKSAGAVGTAAHKTAGAADKSKEKVGDAAEKTGDAIGTAAKATGKAAGTAAHKTADAVGAGADKTKDAAITTEVKTKLLGDGKTPGLKIDVDTDDGVVTLNGDVPNAEARTEAVRLARTTKGVKRVVDKLTVAGK